MSDTTTTPPSAPHKEAIIEHCRARIGGDPALARGDDVARPAAAAIASIGVDITAPTLAEATKQASDQMTAVINATACGLIQEARRHPHRIGKVLAGRDDLGGQDLAEVG